MYYVKFPPVLRNVFERVRLDELKWVSRLRPIIHADAVESCAVVTDAASTGSAEQV